MIYVTSSVKILHVRMQLWPIFTILKCHNLYMILDSLVVEILVSEQKFPGFNLV